MVCLCSVWAFALFLPNWLQDYILVGLAFYPNPIPDLKLHSLKTDFSQFWERLQTIGVEGDMPELHKEIIRGANLSCIWSFIYGTLTTLGVSFLVPPPYIYVPFVGCFLYLLGLLFSHLRMYDWAGATTWIVSSLLFFWLSGAYGKDSNAYLLFIVAEILAIFNFRIHTTKWLVAQLAFPVLLAVITYLTDFSLFSIPTLTDYERAIIAPILFFCVLLTTATMVWTYGNHVKNHIRQMELTQNKLQEKYKELQKAHEELHKTNEELDRFVYSVSHDLRAPITSAMGLIDICEQEHGNDVSSYLNLLKKSMFKLDSFIRDILHYARNSRLDIVPNPLNFEQIIQETYENQAFSNSAEDVRLFTHVKGSEVIFADEFRVGIILSNLISNAIRYRDTNKPVCEIHFHIDLEPSRAIVKISDNGIGIPKQHLQRIFEMFYRANAKISGSGLGLYIVSEAVKKMNGSVRVESEEGVGTTFILTIPNLK